MGLGGGVPRVRIGMAIGFLERNSRLGFVVGCQDHVLGRCGNRPCRVPCAVVPMVEEGGFVVGDRDCVLLANYSGKGYRSVARVKGRRPLLNYRPHAGELGSRQRD